MNKTLRNMRNIALAVTFASLAGFGVSTAAIAASSDTAAEPRFEVNAAGQTFGTGDGEVDPDLIRAQGTNGKVGYVLRTDLVGPPMTSPAEVDAWLHAFPQNEPRDIPLYESDGHTVIGTFTIAATDLTQDPGKD